MPQIITRRSQPRSELTKDQQLSVRSKLMAAASTIARQMEEYLDSGESKHPNGKIIEWNRARLSLVKMILDRTVPPLLAVSMDIKERPEKVEPTELLDKIVNFFNSQPELRDQLARRLDIAQATDADVKPSEPRDESEDNR